MAQNTEIQKTERAIAAPEETKQMPTYLPPTDIYETNTEIRIVCDMPGVDEKNVDIRLEDNVLTMIGHILVEEEKEHDSIFREFMPGDYQRSFSLSEDIDRNNIKAKMKDGVLRITMAKSEEARPKRISVEADK